METTKTLAETLRSHDLCCPCCGEPTVDGRMCPRCDKHLTSAVIILISLLGAVAVVAAAFCWKGMTL